MDHPDAAPVALIHDPDLVEPVHRLAAAAGVTVEVVTRPEAMPSRLSTRPGLLVDPAALDLLALHPATPARTTVITADEPDASTWRRALDLRADGVVVLPREQQRVLDWLTDLTATRRTSGVVVGLVGARGGAGASTLAACMARVGVRRSGFDVTLIDIDDLGGGIELLLGSEDVQGLRWHDIAGTRGRISPAALSAALPRDDGVAVLSWGRGDATGVSPTVMKGVVQAARRAVDLVLVDLPRHLDPAAVGALAVADTLLVICPADVRGAAGAARVLSAAGTCCADARVVVRTGGGSTVTPGVIADSLGIPLAGAVPTVRGLERAVSDGLGPPVTGRLGRAAERLLDGLVPARRSA